MKILVTGAEGFVGKELVNELKKKYVITKFDSKTGQNILDKKNLRTYLIGVDCVIHLAGIIDNSNEKLWQINVEGTKNIIEESLNAHVKKFIFLSSTGVYGFTKGIIDENSDLKPENDYEKSKFEGEQIILNKQEEIQVNIIRSAMIFGNNDYWKKMIKLLEKNIPLPCNGKNKFQIIYVKELVNAIITVLENGSPNEIYLVAGKEKPTLTEFCKKIKKNLEKNEKIIHLPSFVAIIIGKIFRIKIINRENIRHLSKERNYSIEKLNAIGYKQKYSIDEAIKMTVNEIKKQKNKLN